MIQTLPILTREKAETRLKINLMGTEVIELSILGGIKLDAKVWEHFEGFLLQ